VSKTKRKGQVTPKKRAKPAKAKKPAKAAKPAARKAVRPAKAKTRPKAPKPKPKKAPRARPRRPSTIAVNVNLYEPVMPIDRGERYEDPVFAALEQGKLGGPGDGGGTLSSKDGEIEQVDFDVEIASLDAIPVIVRVLEEAGAPKASELRYEVAGESVVVPFGITEGVAIYLDGITQAPEVYASTSAQVLLDQLLDTLGDDGDFRGSWKGPTETALYLYGLDAEQLFATIEPVLRAYPLSQNARVVLRHGHPSLGAREVRLAEAT